MTQEEKGFPMTEKTNPLRDDILAEESQQGADEAQVLPARLERYSTAKYRALRMADYASGQGEARISSKLHDCGQWLLFRDYYTAGKIRLYAGKFCWLPLLCPFCALRRAAKMMKAYMDKLALVQAEAPGLQVYFVTFTIKNGPDLGERFKHLRSAMKSMTQARRDHLSNPKKNRHVEFAKAVGGVHAIESKRGANSQEWHPHAHMIWLCYEKPDAAKLAEEWKHWTGDSFVVDVRPFENQADLVGGFLELFKYALKFSDLPLPDNWEAYKRLKGKRLIDSFGCLRGVEVPDEMTDEGFDDLPYVEMLYRYTRAGYSLVKVGGMNVETGEVDHERLSLADVKFYRE